MEKKVSKIKESAAAGAGSVIGATVGVVGANVVAQSVNASEVTDQDSITAQTEDAFVTPDPVRPQEEHENTTQPEQPSSVSSDPEVEVLGYETQTYSDGSQADFAVVSVDGQPVAIGDLDQDGTADVMVADLNNNGVIENHEAIDISGENIAMQPLQDAAGTNDNNAYLAVNDTPDYVNDADVDAYMA